VSIEALVLARALASEPADDTLYHACGDSRSPGIACRIVWNLTHSSRAAGLTDVFFAGPAHLVARIGFVLLLAVAVRFAVHRVIRRIVARASADSTGAERGRVLFRERRQQRATALGSVLQNAATLTIFGIAAITILGDMGINLAPVLASAGVLGIAIGFGAQSLMQDFLAGIFMLMEDQYGVGDVVNIGAISGIVGLAGGLGGFVLPILFGVLMDLTGIRSSAFMLMYGVVWVSLIWMYWTEVRKTEVMGLNAREFSLAG